MMMMMMMIIIIIIARQIIGQKTSLPNSRANCDLCRHVLLMLNYYVLMFIRVFGTDPGWQSLCDAHYKVTERSKVKWVH